MAVLSPTTLPTLDFISFIKGVDAALAPGLSVTLDFKSLSIPASFSVIALVVKLGTTLLFIILVYFFLTSCFDVFSSAVKSAA